MSWIAKAKDVSSSNPNNSKLHHFQDLQPMAILEPGEPIKFQGTGPSEEVITALIDHCAGMVGKVDTLIQAVQKHDPPPSKNPIYDAILKLDDVGASLTDVSALAHYAPAGSNAYQLTFKIFTKSAGDVAQLQNAYYDCKHINKKGPPT